MLTGKAIWDAYEEIKASGAQWESTSANIRRIYNAVADKLNAQLIKAGEEEVRWNPDSAKAALKAIIPVFHRAAFSHVNDEVIASVVQLVFSVLADADHQLTFIIQFVCEFRVIKRCVRLQHSTFRLHENYRFFGNLITELFRMRSIVTANTKNFHIQEQF